MDGSTAESADIDADGVALLIIYSASLCRKSGILYISMKTKLQLLTRP